MSETKPASQSILDSYVMTPPTDQNAIDILKGEWASKFPPPFDHLAAGGVPLFQDHRLSWGLERMGGVQGKTVLELGPLEAGHTYVISRAGAAFVSAIEANSRAYLKCLIAKEILGLDRTRFWCGDFITYMQTTTQRYDVLVAAGVLYHMKDPLKLLELIGRCASRAYIWTHYYDPKIITDSWYLKQRFTTTTQGRIGDTSITLHRQDYHDSLTEKSYCGGSDEYSIWLSRDGLLAALKAVGFTEFEVNFETPDHPHGPALSLVAIKK